MSAPRRRSPADIRMQLVEAAARMLAEEGVEAVTARRVTAEVGTSTMAVYTHFGSMDELLAEVWREGFARFGAELERGASTDDPVADWMTQGWGYRHFARREPHLYKVMFGEGMLALRRGQPESAEAAMATFRSLLGRLERCVGAGRFAIDDVVLAGEIVWAASHGHAVIELTGYHEALGRDAVTAFREGLFRLAVGFGDEPDRARSSLDRSLRRARRAGLL